MTYKSFEITNTIDETRKKIVSVEEWDKMRQTSKNWKITGRFTDDKTQKEVKPVATKEMKGNVKEVELPKE